MFLHDVHVRLHGEILVRVGLKIWLHQPYAPGLCGGVPRREEVVRQQVSNANVFKKHLGCLFQTNVDSQTLSRRDYESVSRL